MPKKEDWEEKFDKLMFELPVNDYRVRHEDLITKDLRLTLRGETIKSFMRALLLEERSRIIGIAERMKKAEENCLKKGIAVCTYQDALDDLIKAINQE